MQYLWIQSFAAMMVETEHDRNASFSSEISSSSYEDVKAYLMQNDYLSKG